MSGINTHYKPAVLLTYFSQNVSLGCLLEPLVVLITVSPPSLGLDGATETAGEPERGEWEQEGTQS